MPRLRAAAAASALLVIAALAACSPVGPDADADPPAADPTPTVTVTAEPAPAEPIERTADTPIDLLDAYALCRAYTWTYFETETGLDLNLIDYASFADSQVVERTDGLVYVYIEVENGNTTSEAQREVAANCILGGTIGEPEIVTIGAQTREPASQRDPNAPLPQA
jgi:hypothetical protein